jgi:hypothetical protein
VVRLLLNQRGHNLSMAKKKKKRDPNQVSVLQKKQSAHLPDVWIINCSRTPSFLLNGTTHIRT